MNKHIATILAACGLLSQTHAIEQKVQPAPKPLGAVVPAKPKGLGLKDGDRFIFIGDSITHQCLYTQYVENFYYTRHPEMRIHFRNAGVSGDRAQDALNRWDEDIASFKPTIATVLLGMNDASYKDFDMPTFETYAKGMTELMDKLDAIKCRVILMSPTMFDHQAFEEMVKANPERSKGKTPTNYNGVLAYYGKWAQEVARKRGYQFVDLYGPLNTLTVQGRKDDPTFTLIKDAIHPGADGQLIMAYSLLTQTNETGGVLGTGVRLVKGEWKPLGPIVTDIKGIPGKSVSYTVKQSALPWAEFQDAPIGTKLARSGHTAGQESHIVVGLEAGRYDLKINGETVGTFDEKALGVHAEIEEMATSPTAQQALKVIALNKERNDKAVHPMRDLWGKQKGMFNKRNDPANAEAYEKWQTEFKAKREELEKLAKEYEDKIYEANKLQPIKVEVVPAAAPEPAKAAPKAKEDAKKPALKKAA
jgi:lysophospholipase L1-like esterase